MKSRIRIPKKSTREQTPDFSTAPPEPMFQSRPFVVQTKREETSQQPDLKTKLMRSERYGHHLSRMHPVGVSAATAVQKGELHGRGEDQVPREEKSELTEPTEKAKHTETTVVQRMIGQEEVNRPGHGFLANVGGQPVTGLQVKKAMFNRTLFEVRQAVGVQTKEELKDFVSTRSELKGIIQDEIIATINAHPANDYLQTDNLEAIRSYINNCLTRIKEKVTPPNPTISRLRDVKIGNEFTFTNDTLANFHQKMKYKKQKPEEQMTEYRDALANGPYQEVVTQWRNAMADYGFQPTQEPDKYGYPAYKFSFPNIEWSYTLTVDDSCVEVITPPVAAKNIAAGEIAHAMDTYIFGVAQQVNLRADKHIGGGHINIDRQTGFESGGRKLHIFLTKFMEDSTFWKKLDPDFKNAVFPDENDRITQLNKVLNEVQTQVDQEKEVDQEQLVINLISQVFNKNKAKQKDKDSPHYQAVNLEHYTESENTPQEQRRIEVRRVPAQVSRAELLTQLERIFTLMEGKTPAPTS